MANYILGSHSFPEFIVLELPTLDVEKVRAYIQEHDLKILHIGPDLIRDDALDEFVNACIKHIEIPLILDGNALRVLNLRGCKERAPLSVVLSAQPSEFQWLFPQLASDDVEFLATRASMLTQQIIIFKGEDAITALGTFCIRNDKEPPFKGLMSSDIMARLPDEFKRALQGD
jgi:NAD(P)H-hydrate repair Nnr-like enzyme with NAD(P)H-hydrate dehydratase domain